MTHRISPPAHPNKPRPSAPRNFVLISEVILPAAGEDDLPPFFPDPPDPPHPTRAFHYRANRQEELPQPYVLSFQPQPQMEGPGTARRDQSPRRQRCLCVAAACLPPIIPPARLCPPPPFMLKIKGSGTYEMLLRSPSLTIPPAQLLRLLLQARRIDDHSRLLRLQREKKACTG